MEVVKEEASENEVMEKTPEKPKFDPNKSYRWNKEDIFYLNGGEFGAILNALRIISNDPKSLEKIKEAEQLVMLQQANKFAEGSLARAFDAGIVKEQEEKQ